MITFGRPESGHLLIACRKLRQMGGPSRLHGVRVVCGPGCARAELRRAEVVCEGDTGSHLAVLSPATC